MHKLSTGLPVKQAGFTLIELVIVIVIIGILAAVAVPNMSNTTDEARKASANAALGALKSSYAIVYSVQKRAPTCSEVATQVIDPGCSAEGTAITCPKVFQADGATLVTFTCAAATLNSSKDISCTTGC